MCNQFISTATNYRPLSVETLKPQRRDSQQCVVLRQVLADMKRHRLADGSPHKLAETLNALGLVRLHMQSDASSARECHAEALRIFRDLQDLKSIAITLSDLGYCFERLEQREPALQHYQEAIMTLQQANCEKSHPRMIATQRAVDRIVRSP